MIFFIKKLLYKLLSQRLYLKTLQKGFYAMYNLGLLKNDYRFKYHYLIKEIIEPDYFVVDIGANLGYFSKNFAKLASKGKVICVEPVKPFFEALNVLLTNYSNAKVYNYALGNETGKITMVLPESNGMIRTGLPHIAESEEEKTMHKTHEVEIVLGSKLFGDLDRIDYIKCDIEGYEGVVFNEIKEIVKKHKPIVQIEIGPDNETAMLTYFSELGYLQYGVANFKVIREDGKQQEQGDFLFVHNSQQSEFENKMKLKGRM